MADQHTMADGAPVPATVSFVMPAKDEEARLGASIDALLAFAAKQSYRTEIIVVDDGSSDRTASIAFEAANGSRDGLSVRVIQHDQNRGKGAAVRTGVLAAEGDPVLFLDADLSTPVEEAPKLLSAIAAGADVAAGSRVMPGGGDMRASQPALRRLGGRAFAMARKRLLLSDIEDTQCGFKAFRRDVARDVFPLQRLEGWAFDAEILYLARRLGYTVRSVPVQWQHAEGSRFKLGPGAVARELRDILRIRWLHRDVRRPQPAL